MTKSKGGKNETKNAAPAKKSKPKREVEVVSCPAGFPISTKTGSRKRPRGQEKDDVDSSDKFLAGKKFQKKKKDSGFLDIHAAAKEVRAFGATAFAGKQKRDYQDEEYFRLTGRHKKKQRVPLPIVRGIKKAAEKREARNREEARQAGIVLPKAAAAKKKEDTTYKHYGPAPNIGFMKGGVFRVKKDKR